MLDTVASRVYGYIHGFVTGTITRYQKLKWLGKLIVILVLLAYIALAVVVVAVGPATLFQVGINFCITLHVAHRRF